jgi:salicylate hydroxylase
MSQVKFTVGIIGGGLGGLCLAQGLKKDGIDVRVFERDRTFTERLQGYRIHINPTGSRALSECLPEDLYQRFALTCGQSSGRFTFRSERMEELLEFKLAEGEDSIDSHKSVSRMTLRNILLTGLDDVVLFGKRFVEYKKQTDGTIAISFEDGSNEVCDVLVAADGGNSRVRQQFLPHAQRVDTGCVGVAGKLYLTDQSKPLVNQKLLLGPTLISTAAQRSMFIAPFQLNRASDACSHLDQDDLFDNEHDYIMWGFGAAKELYGQFGKLEEMDGAELQKVVLKLTEGWHVELQQLVRWCKPGTISLLPIRTSVPIKHWATTNITLLGDAIHSMTPYRGIGANTALQDAAVLRRQLRAAHLGFNDLLQSIHDYEVQMIEYGFGAVNTSLRALKQSITGNEIEVMCRRTAYKAINSLPQLKQLVFSGTGR